MLACAPLTSLLCFLLPYPTHASGFLLVLQLVSNWLAACHVVLVVGPLVFLVCWLAGYASMCPSDLRALFSVAQHTHASGSRLIVQDVSDCQPARHVVLVMCPRCPDV
jgi:hypothetical protein